MITIKTAKKTEVKRKQRYYINSISNHNNCPSNPCGSNNCDINWRQWNIKKGRRCKDTKTEQAKKKMKI